MGSNEQALGIGKPCDLPLARGHLLIIGTGAIGVSNLPGWCTAIRQWYGHDVYTILTNAAQQLVSEQAIAATSGAWPFTAGFSGGSGYNVPHKQLSKWADLIIVAPATLNFIARTALMMPDSLATYTALLTHAPLVLAPSVPGHLWHTDRIHGYVKELRNRGWKILEPSRGLAVSDSSIDEGALPSIYEVLLGASSILQVNGQQG